MINVVKYIIIKSTRLPQGVTYDGPTWDHAGIRHLRKDYYTNAREAEEIVKVFNVYNPVGFEVAVPAEVEQ